MGYPLIALAIAGAATVLGTVNQVRAIKSQAAQAKFNEKYNYNVLLEAGKIYGKLSILTLNRRRFPQPKG